MTRIEIKSYKIVVKLRCWDSKDRRKMGYPVIFQGFHKYRFAVHRMWSDKSLWHVTELSSGIAFNPKGRTRKEAVEKAYKSLVKNKEKFKKRVQEYIR